MDLPAEIVQLISPEIMANITREGVGTKEIFFLLNEEDLKELGFHMGARRVILKIIEQNINSAQLPIIVEVITEQSDPSTNGQPDASEVMPEAVPVNIPPIDVLTILRKPQRRKKVIDGAILAEKLLNGDVTSYNTDPKQSERRFLVRTLGAYLMKAGAVIDMPSKEEKITMARSIVETFPVLRSQELTNGYELYYDPIGHTGFLETYIRGHRSNNENIVTRKYKKRKLEVEESSSVKEAKDYIARNKVTPSNQRDMQRALDVTRSQRRLWISGPEKPSITSILRKYPRFQDMDISIRQEFLSIVTKSYSSFQEEWRKVELQIIDIAETRKPLGSEAILNSMDPDVPETLSHAAFLLLPFLLPCQPHRGKKEPRPSPVLCGQLLIAEFDETTSIAEAIKEMEKKMMQPGLLIIGENYFLKLDNSAVKLTVSNIAEAVEYLFMSFFVFNVQYPYQLKSVYNFFEYMCKISDGTKSIPVNTLTKLFK